MHTDSEKDFEDLDVKSNDFGVLESVLDTGDDNVLVNNYRETINKLQVSESPKNSLHNISKGLIRGIFKISML